MKSSHDFPSLNKRVPDGIKPGGKSYKVMVVESKEFHRKQLVSVLESEGYEVVSVASNGEEALKLYDEHKKSLDLITTALDMPVLDGYAFLFELKERGFKAKLVFISEDTTKGVVEDLLAMGAADFILKPIGRVRILQRIKQILETAPK